MEGDEDDFSGLTQNTFLPNRITLDDDLIIINLFINSDAILNRDALWSIQGKNHHVNAAIVRGIRRTGKVLR